MDWGSMPRSETGFEGNSMASLDLKAKPAVFFGRKKVKGKGDSFYRRQRWGQATVDGRNPAPADMVNIPIYTVLYIPGGAGFFPAINSINLIYSYDIQCISMYHVYVSSFRHSKSTKPTYDGYTLFPNWLRVKACSFLLHLARCVVLSFTLQIYKTISGNSL